MLQPLQAGQKAQQTDPVCRGADPRAEVCVCVYAIVNPCKHKIPSENQGVASAVKGPLPYPQPLQLSGLTNRHVNPIII